MWKNGSTPITMSLDVRRGLDDRVCSRLATRLRCVSITPLGTPDVPLEYGRAQRSSAVLIVTSGTGRSGRSNVAKAVAPSASPKTYTSSQPAAVAAARHFSSSSGIVIKMRARESVNCFAISSAVDTGLTVLEMAPITDAARKTIAYSGRFGLTIPITSPFVIPRACSPAAHARIAACNCA